MGTITCLDVCRSFSIIVSGSEVLLSPPNVTGMLTPSSQDKTCIIWDLNRLRYVRSLYHAQGPPIPHQRCQNQPRNGVFCSFPLDRVAVGMGSIQSLFLTIASLAFFAQGDIVTCSGTHANVWTVNGDLLVSVRTSKLPSEAISCALFTQVSLFC